MSGDVRRRIGALERVAGDVGAESGDGEPIDLAALAEAVAVSIERYSGEAARERSGARTDIQPVENFSAGRALDKVADAVGMSRPTLTKAQEVIGEAVQE